MIDKVLSFYVDNNLFGIDIKLIKEINRNVEYTPIPDAKEEIIGLLNMRGQVVTLFDFSKLIGLNKQTGNRNTCIILKSNGNETNYVGFIIDRPGDVIDINKEDCEAPPANVSSLEGEYIHNIVKLKDNLLIIINPDKLFK